MIWKFPIFFSNKNWGWVFSFFEKKDNLAGRSTNYSHLALIFSFSAWFILSTVYFQIIIHHLPVSSKKPQVSKLQNLLFKNTEYVSPSPLPSIPPCSKEVPPSQLNPMSNFWKRQTRWKELQGSVMGWRQGSRALLEVKTILLNIFSWLLIVYEICCCYLLVYPYIC